MKHASALKNLPAPTRGHNFYLLYEYVVCFLVFLVAKPRRQRENEKNVLTRIIRSYVTFFYILPEEKLLMIFIPRLIHTLSCANETSIILLQWIIIIVNVFYSGSFSGSPGSPRGY